MKDVKFGETLAKLRRDKGLTQEQFAEAMDITRQAICKWEKGNTSPDIWTLTRIAEFFGVTLDELIYGDERRTE